MVVVVIREAINVPLIMVNGKRKCTWKISAFSKIFRHFLKPLLPTRKSVGIFGIFFTRERN